MTRTIFVYLHNEGTDVWRPVEATDCGHGMYRITSVQTDPDERWKFRTGDLVRCETREFHGGDGLVAVERIEAEPTPVRIIDGAAFETLDEFYDEIERALIPGAKWGRNLDAFNDILRGGFGTPDGGFVLVWRNADLSRRRLGHDETARILRVRLGTCHPSNREAVKADAEAAARGEGPTLFDTLVEIVRDHGPGGEEPEDNVLLRLE